MNEEQVTKAILKWLLSNEWKIVCFDFPQSGTGKILHPNNSNNDKNKEAIIPDIVAVKDNVCIFCENKDRFYYPDYEKQHILKTSNKYEKAIEDLLKDYSVNKIFYGIGLPETKYKQISKDAAHLVDFIICVNDDKTINIAHNSSNIIFT